MESAVLSDEGQVTIPSKMRSALGLKSGDRVILDLRDHQIVIEPQGAKPEARLVTNEFGKRVLTHDGPLPDLSPYAVQELLCKV